MDSKFLAFIAIYTIVMYGFTASYFVGVALSERNNNSVRMAIKLELN